MTTLTAGAKRPQGVTVGPRRYAVVVDDVVTGGHEAHGLCQAEWERITLSPNQGPATMRESLLHEVLHACFHDAAPFGALIGDAKEEKVCAHVAPRLLDTLRRNPALVAYLTGNG